MMFDYSKLRGKIREKYGTQEAFAEAMGISAVSLSGKLNGKVDWTSDEINRACILLEIESQFIPVYFFKELVKEL